jgi:glutamine synthetase
VLSPRELHSRYEVYLEHYNKSVKVEANVTIKLAKTAILPAALRYQAELAVSSTAAKALGTELKLPAKLAGLIGELEKSIEALETVLGQVHGQSDGLKEAQFFADKVLPAMTKVRESADLLEGIVADDLWPLPTYQEMLFIR